MPEAHLLVIGELMAAISPLVESQDTALTSGLDDLEAFDNVATAGPLDRLVTTELMWLKLMPGEFIRRVAEGEALRRHPTFQDPSEDRALVVLLDNGPRMLGRRRLVALAALLTLGAAATRRGGRFHWAATNHIGPAWHEGINRRALSCYINQAGAEGLDMQRLDGLLYNAPVDISDDRTITWAIVPRDTSLEPVLPLYRFEIDEPWPPIEMSTGDITTASRYADVFVISSLGVRRSARFTFPDEQICADTLRDPFRKTGRQKHRDIGITNWAPDWISPEANDGAAIIRDEDGIVLYRKHSAVLRVDINEAASVLGVRWPGNGPCIIVWRQDDEIHSMRINQAGDISQRVSTMLADDHPLIAGSHAISAVPPLFRFVSKAALTIGAPDGRLYTVSISTDAGHEALSVALADQIKDMRLLARSRSWILCTTERGGQSAFVLIHVRTGRRIFLRRDAGLKHSSVISCCEVIGETGGPSCPH